MRYVIEQSFDPKELNHSIWAEKIAPKIGKTLSLKDGRSYQIIDVQFFQTKLRGTVVNGVLKRIK